MRKTPAASSLLAVMSIHPSMSRKSILLAALAAVLLLPACSEKSEAEKAEEERAAIREERRKKAIEVYKTLAKEYPDDPKAAEARQKAAALEALAPKK
jgi:hypothetical protein